MGLYLFQILTPEVVIEKLIQSGDPESAEYMRSQLDEDIMTCMVDVLKVSGSHIYPDSY